MAVDNARIAELRRRVHADPSSIAFAQLAEELRRAGANEEAIDVCQSGLTRHPGYLSARVTLGRALLELGQLDDAHVELSVVVENAPDNLAAIRGMAEIHQRRGELADALIYYRRALELARHDPELEETVERIQKEVVPPVASETDLSVEALFDFDRLVEQLGAATPPGVEALDALRPESAPVLPPSFPAGAAADDRFARLEADLRQHDDRVAAERQSIAAHDAEALAELETWLDYLKSSPR